MSFSKARRLAALALAFGTAVQAPCAHAAYPERTITLIVPFAPGGPTDAIARIISLGFQRAMGQSVIVENRGGAGGNVGMQAVARSAPDGYTLLLASTAIAVNPALSRNIGYDPVKDFAPISELVTTTNVVVVQTRTGMRSIADLVARANAAPGTFNFSSPGVGTKAHLMGAQLKMLAKIDMQHVPFRGAGPAALAVLDNSVQVGATSIVAAEGLIKDGQLTALTVTSAKRWFSLPEVPNLIEQGFPGFVADTFSALLAPARTPPDIVARLVAETQAVLNAPEARAQAQRVGFEIVAGSPEALARRIATETAEVKDLVERIGLKPE